MHANPLDALYWLDILNFKRNAMIPLETRSAFRHTLLSGGYNLLLGSGVCLDSQNGRNEGLRTADKLRQDLCVLKQVREGTSLPRVAALLTPNERDEHLVTPFSNCRPGTSLAVLPHYIWRRLFTFNIDDVFENLYHTADHPKQVLNAINYDAPFEPTPDRGVLSAVHLHGWVGKPESEFVFSFADYARIMRTLNPWMHMLAEILPTEPFIIAGTSLNESDLEYYLSHRSEATPRTSRGPSVLIEPHPDAATEADCRRYGLVLVKATLGEFLAWLSRDYPSPPTLAELIVPDVSTLFPDKTISARLLPFFADFKLLTAAEKQRSPLPSGFLYGREPTQDDLDEGLDIQRADNDRVASDVEDTLAHCDDPTKPRLVLLLDDAGTGKTTVILRVAHQLVHRGVPVLGIRTLSRIDVKNAVDCLTTALRPIVLVVDRLADHVEQIVEILFDARTSGKVVVLAAERAYRKEYLDLALGVESRIDRKLRIFTQGEASQLIELFRGYGLIGTSDAVHRPVRYASELEGDSVAIAVCRILNDFRPLDRIVESLWEETPANHRLPYLCAAHSTHCHAAGLRYSILQGIAGRGMSLANLLKPTIPLSLAENPQDDEYVVPMNAMYAERILQRAISKDQESLLAAFKGIA